MKNCKHDWELYWHDEDGRLAVKFRFYCRKCLIFKALSDKDINYE